MLLWLLGAVEVSTGEEQARERARTTDPQHKLDCQRNLTKIYDALQEYQQKYTTIPNWLSELVPEFISDPQVLVCPYVNQTGDLSRWREGLLKEPGNDRLTYYHYEFCLEKPRRGLPEDATLRDYKYWQMVFLRDTVPIVRCLAHNPILNLAWGGGIYENLGGVYWEDNFTHLYDHEMHRDKILFPAARYVRSLDAQLPLPVSSEDFSLLDLSNYFHIPLYDVPAHPMLTNASNLAILPKGVHKFGGTPFRVHGVVHLTRNSRNLPFPTEVRDIIVRQRCLKLHLLHGAVFSEVSAGEVSRLVVHYSDGLEEPLSLHSAGNDVTAGTGRNDTLLWQAPISAKDLKDRTVTLYRTSWNNPNPGKEIVSIDFISAMTEAAPFLLAVSLE
ncbi:MAG: hypothetical protein L0Y58_13695 [Verrucomicrobia subdivision 3 bacterium]|nr:hypothetical protein [Limisphaerales bacterium]